MPSASDLRANERELLQRQNDEYKSLVRDLKPIFKTEGEVCIYASNGHGAWEAALVNVLSPGDRVLVQETGHFTRNWSKMAESHGAVIECLPGDWRRALDPQVLEDAPCRSLGEGLSAMRTNPPAEFPTTTTS